MNANFNLDDLGYLSHPFAAKFAGVCALSGDKFMAGDQIRMTTRIGQEKALPVKMAWLCGIPWHHGAKIVTSVDDLLAAIRSMSPERSQYQSRAYFTNPKDTVWIWTKPTEQHTHRITRIDGVLELNGTKVSEAQLVSRCLKHAKVWKLSSI